MTSNDLLQRAEECRMAAGRLKAIAVVSGFTGAAVWFTTGPGHLFLACAVLLFVNAVGAWNESIDAAHLQHRAENNARH